MAVPYVRSCPVYLAETAHQPRHQLHVLPQEHREGFVWKQHVASIYLSQRRQQGTH